jgi:hypothetical protein
MNSTAVTTVFAIYTAAKVTSRIVIISFLKLSDVRTIQQQDQT